MKITRGLPDKFVPVTIVLETEEEVQDLWHILNIGSVMSLVRYVQTEASIEPSNHPLGERRYRMWEKLNSVYPLREKEEV